MRILLPLHGFVRWNGGLDLVRLVSSAIESADAEIHLTFALPNPSASSRLLQAALRRLRGIAAGARSIGAGGEAALLGAATEIVGEHPMIVCADSGAGIVEAARKSRADVVFPTMMPLGRDGPTRVGYLFDFQHRHLPELFSARTRRNRDRRFSTLARDADGVVVNSRAAAQDVIRFLGIPAARILAMPFAPYALPHWFDASPEEAQQRYGIQGRYLLVCNHFWKHKDHATALKAFALLREMAANADLELVLTGDPIDHRDPQHYGRLLALADSLGVSRVTRFLGLIPKRDQLALMRGCAALLQPTLFEGGPGGGSVYEAVGLGVPAVVSDIPINREIDIGDVRFFCAGNASDLASKVAGALASPTGRPSREVLLANGERSLSRLGGAIGDYLSDIVQRA